jgi:hypothetical protein
MRVLIPKLRAGLAGLGLIVLAAIFVSCATQKQTALVKDPDAGKDESLMPWNKQEKWETSSQQLGGVTDRR